MLTGETMNGGAAQEPSSYDAWFSAVWFALPHVDLRLDTIYAKSGVAGTPTSPSSYTNSTSWLAQFHVWL
jgi:hypothetical protein